MKSQTAGGGGPAAVTEVPASNKKEKTAPQATAEQLRIAEITNISNERDIADLNENIRMIVELTHRTPDEAAMALHDSNGSVEDAVNILLEGSPDDNGWETTGKKKKEKQSVPEVRSKDDIGRKANDDRAGGRGGKGRGTGRTAGGAPQAGGRGRPRGGPRSRTGGRDGQPGSGKKNRGDAGDENSSHWNNGTANEFDEDFKNQQKETNDQQQNDTIKNMGSYECIRMNFLSLNDPGIPPSQIPPFRKIPHLLVTTIASEKSLATTSSQFFLLSFSVNRQLG